MLTPTFNANNDFTFIKENVGDDILDVYPNPFYSTININSHYSYSIRDVMGRLIFSGNDKNRINTSDWNSGMYFIHLNNNIMAVKIIKI